MSGNNNLTGEKRPSLFRNWLSFIGAVVGKPAPRAWHRADVVAD
jgi:hypothetical protein